MKRIKRKKTQTIETDAKIIGVLFRFGNRGVESVRVKFDSDIEPGVRSLSYEASSKVGKMFAFDWEKVLSDYIALEFPEAK